MFFKNSIKNLEWFREPLSPLEKTLRLRLIYKHILIIFVVRFLPRYFILLVLLYLIQAPFTPLIAFIIFFASEMFLLESWYHQRVLPKHKKSITEIRDLASKITKDNTPEVIKLIKKAANASAWSIVNIGYLIVPSWGWEIILKTVYPVITKKGAPLFQDLFVFLPGAVVTLPFPRIGVSSVRPLQ